jgi:hypothetical protein
VTRTIYGPDGKPISSEKPKSEKAVPVVPGSPVFRAMQKTLHLSENQLRGAIRRSAKIARKTRLKGTSETLQLVRERWAQESRDEAKRATAERKSKRLEAVK